MRWAWLLLLAGCVEVEGDDPGECADGEDNDDDGLLDCADAGCWESPDCDEEPVETAEPQDTSPPEDTQDTQDTGHTGDSGDSEETGDTSETGDTGDTGDPSDQDGDGWSVDDDCDDTDPLTHPGALEWPDGADNDCDGSNDEDTIVPDGAWLSFAGTDDDGDECGTGVAGFGDGVAIACEGSGSVHVFWAPGMGSYAPEDAHQTVTMARAGEAVTGGDFDGDGALEFFVHDLYATTTQHAAGRIGMIEVSDGDIAVSSASYLLNGAVYEGNLGGSLATLDWNDDGVDDLLVGEKSSNATQRVWVVPGPLSPGSTTTASAGGAAFHYNGGSGTPTFNLAQGTGDFDGDGVDDLLASHGWAKKAWVVEGPVWVQVHIEDVSSATWSGGLRFGWAVTWAGDQDGDGLDDLAVTEPMVNGYEGAVYVILGGSSSGPAVDEAHFTINGDASHSWVGETVAATDLNGDGVPEIAQGSVADGGYVSVHHGGQTGSQTVSASAVLLTENDGGFGWDSFYGDALATFDADGDGHGDLITAAWQEGIIDGESGGFGGRVWIVGDTPAPSEED